MTWLLSRQHRSQGLVAGVLLSVFAAVVAVTGTRMAHTYAEALRRCPAGICDLQGQLFQGDGAIMDLIRLTIAVPILLGVFLGATLVARETEQATNVLVWTQSVTRRCWVLSKVALALGGTLACATAVAVLVTWWSRTTNSLYHNRFDPSQFDLQNLAPVAYALFAVALGLCAGCLLRRTLPAIAVTVGAMPECAR